MNRHIYTLKKPASWNKEWWKDSLLLGNGLTGALIPGGIGEEEIQFNRHDLWQGGPDREIPDISDTFREMRAMMDAGDYYGANQNNLLSALREKKKQADAVAVQAAQKKEIEEVVKSLVSSGRSADEILDMLKN